METKVFIWLQPSKLETNRAHNKTVEKTIFTGLKKMVEQTHVYRDYQNQEYYADKVHPRVLSISKATRPSRRLICSLLFLSVHAIPEKLAQRLLVSGLSVGLSPFSLLLFLRHWVSLSLFSRLIYDEYNNPLVTCVYIEPVPCLWVCAVKQFVTVVTIVVTLAQKHTADIFLFSGWK